MYPAPSTMGQMQSLGFQTNMVLDTTVFPGALICLRVLTVDTVTHSTFTSVSRHRVTTKSPLLPGPVVHTCDPSDWRD